MSARSKGLSYRVIAGVVRPLLMATTRRDWRGTEHLLGEGGFVVCSNHLSYADPLTLAHFLHDHGCPPRFLAKESLFRLPVAGRLITAAGQIPVHRGTADAGRALSSAVEAVEAGECVVIYPEATLTRDPGLWPMAGKTGAARVALSTGCPVIPVAQWGVTDLLAPYGKRPHVIPRPTVRLVAGPPVDLSAFRDSPMDPPTLRAATETILDAVTRLLADLRQEEPPATRWRHVPERASTEPRPGDGDAGTTGVGDGDAGTTSGGQPGR